MDFLFHVHVFCTAAAAAAAAAAAVTDILMLSVHLSLGTSLTQI
jgi:hypothetical protein